MGCSYEDMQGVLKSLGFQSETIKLEDLPPQLQTPETKTPETETAEPNPEVAAEPVADVVTPAETETAEVSAPNDTESKAVAETPSSDPTKAEPTPSQLRPKKQVKPLNIYHHRETLEDGTSKDIANTEFWFMPRRKPAYKPRDKNAHNRGGHSNKFKGKRKGPKQNKTHTPKPPRKLEDSPFAALAALKNDKRD